MPKHISELPVQMNLKMPLGFKRFLERRSERTKISQNQLVMDALMEKYGKDYDQEAFDERVFAK